MCRFERFKGTHFGIHCGGIVDGFGARQNFVSCWSTWHGEYGVVDEGVIYMCSRVAVCTRDRAKHRLAALLLALWIANFLDFLLVV